MVFALGFLAVGVLNGGLFSGRIGASQEQNPFLRRGMFVATNAQAEQSAATATNADRQILERLAKKPVGIWLTPEVFPPGQVGAHVRQIVSAAGKKKQLPVFVIYGIPDRDCGGGHSDGGLPAGQYPAWVREIATAAGPNAVAILEPDALAAAKECDLVEERVSLLKGAVESLRKGGPTTYVDAGHADWVSPQAMAALLKRVGVDKVRGFSTNVSGYGTNADERAYAEVVSRALGGAHYLIDSGRNGAGSTGDWCNPSRAALGTEPGYIDDGSAQDAYAWIKPPGESDGECGGGPGAGIWWTANALELAANAGW